MSPPHRRRNGLWMQFLCLVACVVVVCCEPTPTLDFDPYEALGVSPDATNAQIRRAFRKLSLRYHPDKNPGDDDARVKFNQGASAYEILGDEDKRRIYDEFGQQEFHTRDQFVRSGTAQRNGDFYGSTTNVLPVSERNFTQPRPKPMLVEFYAPWCVHCQHMATAWRKAALLLDGVVSVGAVNCERQQLLCQRTHINAYPSIFLYPAGNPNQPPEAFNSMEHTAESIVEFVKGVVTPITVGVTTQEFAETVLPSNDLWLMLFSTPWCGPCQAVKPVLRRLAARFEGRLRVGVVDCQRDAQLCQQQRVVYYPFLKLYPRHDKSEFEEGQGVVLEYSHQGHAAADVAINILDAVLRVMMHGEQATPNAGSDVDDDDEADFWAELDAEEL